MLTSWQVFQGYDRLWFVRHIREPQTYWTQGPYRTRWRAAIGMLLAMWRS